MCLVRKVTAGGAASTFFTLGSNPIQSDVAVDPAGIVYVTARDHIDRISPAGALLSSVPSPLPQPPVFDSITGIAVDGSGNIYVADSFDCTLKRVTPDNPLAAAHRFRCRGGGGRRPDVEQPYGPAFGGAGFTLNGSLPGTYDLVVYAHRAESNSFAGAETVRVIVR